MDVIHLQFTSWPDHGVPKTSKDLLGKTACYQSETKLYVWKREFYVKR